ncbi:MAG: TonB-dependent receptor, partial [Colwellia sp.]
MSFIRNIFTLSLMATFAIQSPLVLANADLNEEFNDERDDSLEDFYGDEDFISIATGSKKLISKAPAVASVVTSSDIEEMGARTLSEVLETIPGLHVTFSAEIGAPKFQIRGISTKHNPQTLVLVDGTPITSAVRGDRHIVWGTFPVKSIARIEVIRGPGSAIYGADAFAGVINVITKSSDDIEHTEIGARAGSFNTKEVWFITKFSNDDVKLALTGEFSESEGHDSVIDWDAQSNLDALNFAPPASFSPGSTNTGYKAYDFNLKMLYKNIDFKVLYQDRSNVGSGQGVAEALDPHGQFASKRILVDINYNVKLASNIDSFLSLSHYRSSQEVEENLWLLPPGTLFGAFPDALIGNPEWFEKTSIAKLNFNYEGWGDHKLDFGFGYRIEDLYKVKESKNFDSSLNPLGELIDVSGTDDVFMPESDRESHFLYVQGEFYLAPDWELTAGVRYDNYSDFGSTTNPRLALVWTTSQKLTTKFLYGEAFRAPAFAETTIINNPVALGNPNLKPETINTLEISFNYKASEKLDLNFN